MNEFRESIKDYGRDIRLNISAILGENGAAGLNPGQTWGVALACAYSTRNPALISAVQRRASELVSPEYVEAAKAASTIMAMNNVYYRFTHLVEDREFANMPARLRMNIMSSPGIPKVDFELMCLAISAISGCGACMNSHVDQARKGGLSTEGIQSAVRIASVLNAASQASLIG